jgi:hypothetical protein
VEIYALAVNRHKPLEHSSGTLLVGSEYMRLPFRHRWLGRWQLLLFAKTFTQAILTFTVPLALVAEIADRTNFLLMPHDTKWTSWGNGGCWLRWRGRRNMGQVRGTAPLRYGLRSLTCYGLTIGGRRSGGEQLFQFVGGYYRGAPSGFGVFMACCSTKREYRNAR